MSMGNTWVTDLRHFLNEEGIVPPDLPLPAERLAYYFGSIVKAVTSHKNLCLSPSGIRCRRRPKHRRCPGEILAFIDGEHNAAIRWQCPVCNDNGFISGWQESPWDLS
jgi:hypothetical protein